MHLSPFRGRESPATRPNPLSLAIPDATFDAWAREAPLADARRLGSGQVRRPVLDVLGGHWKGLVNHDLEALAQEKCTLT